MERNYITVTLCEPKITIHDRMDLFFKLHQHFGNFKPYNSFRVLSDKIASVYFIRKIYLYFSIGNGRQHREPALCQYCIGTLSGCTKKVGLYTDSWPKFCGHRTSKYVATLPCNLSLIACFADSSVSQGIVCKVQWDF